MSISVLVCGGRDFNDYNAFIRAMDALPFVISIIIEGGARGADSLAKRYAIEKGIHCAEVPALWDSFGKRAGHLRNEAMLLLNPKYCVAFSGGVGTQGMINLCKKENIPVWEPYG